MTLNPHLLALLVEAWLSCYGEITKHERVGYGGPSPDEILRKAGITFDAERALYLAYETEMRHQAWDRLGGKRTQGGKLQVVA